MTTLSSRRMLRRAGTFALAAAVAATAACSGAPTAPTGTRRTVAKAATSDPGANVSRGGGIKRRGGYNVVAD